MATLGTSRLHPFFSLLLLVSCAFGGETEPPAQLELRMSPGQVLRYDWTLESASNSKGQEKGKPLDLHVDKSIRVAVVLTGEKPPRGEDVLSALLRFEGFRLQENRRVGDAASSTLQVDRQNIMFTENGRVRVDSRNDIGMEKISAHQKALRFLERNVARIVLDRSSRQTRVEGDRFLLDTAHGGSSRGLFPELSGKKSAVGESWTGRFEIPRLAEVELDRAAIVNTRATFAKWHDHEGRKVAMIDVLSSWDGNDLRGKDTAGLTVTLTGVDGHGAGVYLFDPKVGRFVSGTMTFQLKYHLEGEREGEKTALDVNGRSRFNFTLLPDKPKGK